MELGRGDGFGGAPECVDQPTNGAAERPKENGNTCDETEPALGFVTVVKKNSLKAGRNTTEVSV